jgi:hypothetical protein
MEATIPGLKTIDLPWHELELSVDPFGRLLAAWPGKQPVVVEPVRSFPWSSPTNHIALVDEKGVEWVLIPHLEVLNAGPRQLILNALEQRDFVPEILRIVKTEPNSPPCHWTVETNVGVTDFEVISLDDVRRLDSDSVLISDSQGLRYLVSHHQRLDATSRAVLDRYL